MKQQLTTNGILPLDGMEVMEDELMFVLGGASGHGESDSGCSCEAGKDCGCDCSGGKGCGCGCDSCGGGCGDNECDDCGCEGGHCHK